MNFFNPFGLFLCMGDEGNEMRPNVFFSYWYQGTSSTVNYDSCLASAVCNTKILVVEGYLFELPDTIKTITKACEEARRSGALVAVTASDVSCIERHYDDFWYCYLVYCIILFFISQFFFFFFLFFFEGCM